MYFCHKCNATRNFDTFLKETDQLIYQDYIKEKLQSEYSSKSDEGIRNNSTHELAKKMKPPVFSKTGIFSGLKKISSLDHSHEAHRYLFQRKIPTHYHYKLFYAPKFREFVQKHKPDMFKDNQGYDEARIIIPFFDEEKRPFGFQGRALSDSSLRYITIMLDESKPKIFNLDECDRNKQHFVLEGPFDSMFPDNAIAMAGSSIDWDYINKHSVFVFDNEPRSKETCKKIEHVIDRGHSVVIFPENVHGKDINEMVTRHPELDVNALLSKNVSSGLEAKLIFQTWRKV